MNDIFKVNSEMPSVTSFNLKLQGIHCVVCHIGIFTKNCSEGKPLVAVIFKPTLSDIHFVHR